MPLKMIDRGSVTAPVFFCDHCGKEITDAKNGNYERKGTDAEKPAGATMCFTHKECSHAFEQVNGDGWESMELDCLPVYAVHNLKINWEKAKARVKLLGSIG